MKGISSLAWAGLATEGSYSFRSTPVHAARTCLIECIDKSEKAGRWGVYRIFAHTEIRTYKRAHNIVIHLLILFKKQGDRIHSNDNTVLTFVGSSTPMQGIVAQVLLARERRELPLLQHFQCQASIIK